MGKLENNKIYNDYRELQKIVGNSLDAPGKGGNISVKSGKKFLIKASGEDLKENHLICTFKNSVFKSSVLIKNKKFKVLDIKTKPSMEIGFHTAIKAKYVVHYHPAYVLPFLCSDSFTDFTANVIEPCVPGKELEEKIKSLDLNFKSGVIYLKNHGVILYANDLKNIKDLYTEIKAKYFQYFLCHELYTPDDVVDRNSYELLLFRHAIQNIARKNGIELNMLSSYMVQYLNRDSNEKYRQQKMKGNK